MGLKIAAMALGAALAMFAAQADEKHHQGALTDGEVRKVDKDAKKITIKHGPLTNLDMPAMTKIGRAHV